MNTTRYQIIETADRGLYQVVDTRTAVRSQPWPLARCRRILRALLAS